MAAVTIPVMYMMQSLCPLSTEIKHGILFATYNLLKPLLEVCRSAVDVPVHKAAFKLLTDKKRLRSSI